MYNLVLLVILPLKFSKGDESSKPTPSSDIDRRETVFDYQTQELHRLLLRAQLARIFREVQWPGEN